MLTAYKSILLIKPKKLHDGFVQFYTTRYSCISRSHFSSFNLGYFTDDEDVKSNYNQLKKIFDLKNIKLLKQIHSAKIVLCNRYDFSIEEGDGIFSVLNNFFSGIQTADCWTVQLIGKNYFANLHCCWRGIYSCIIENAFELFSKHNDTIEYAYVGPGICVDCYEVGADLIEKFSKVSDKVFYINKNGKYFLDLEKLILEKIKKYNVPYIEVLSYCSFCKDYLYSYRRENGLTGRMLSVLGKL